MIGVSGDGFAQKEKEILHVVAKHRRGPWRFPMKCGSFACATHHYLRKNF